MDIQSVRTALTDQPFGHTIHYHPSVPSTMPLARALAEKADDPAEVSGALVIADEQTAGRGRLARRWETPPGRALLLSVVVAGAHLPERPAQLPMIAGLAVLEAVESIATPDRWAAYETGTCEPTSPDHLSGVEAVSFRLKWPNDLVARLPARLPAHPEQSVVKVAGLLAESRLDSRGIRYAVLGIGVNVNQRANELPAPRPGGLPPASLYTIFGQEAAREALLIALCRALSDLLGGPDRPTAADIHSRWQKALINLGRSVIVRDGKGEGDGDSESGWRGQVVGTDVDGALVIEDARGQRVALSAGDVSIGL